MDSHQDGAGRPGRRRAKTKKKGARPAKAAEKKSDYFMKPAKQGAVSVYRRPCGNRIEPKLCGTMPSRTTALALVRQLERAESVVNDLFLEATDDGIEALEAILRAVRESVEQRADRAGGKRPRGGGGRGPQPQTASATTGAGPATATDTAGDPVGATAGAPDPTQSGDAPARRRRPRQNRKRRPS